MNIFPKDTNQSVADDHRAFRMGEAIRCSNVDTPDMPYGIPEPFDGVSMGYVRTRSRFRRHTTADVISNFQRMRARVLRGSRR